MCIGISVRPDRPAGLPAGPLPVKTMTSQNPKSNATYPLRVGLGIVAPTGAGTAGLTTLLTCFSLSASLKASNRGQRASQLSRNTQIPWLPWHRDLDIPKATGEVSACWRSRLVGFCFFCQAWHHVRFGPKNSQSLRDQTMMHETHWFSSATMRWPLPSRDPCIAMVCVLRSAP